ncbi:MAG: nucleotidyltransferase domain-containing protein [Pseudomonadales bacterium]|jgi:hypothetical protein|nr:nucleotidyltransferase domain-containing protein [Pseudomonadales bacterium]
MQDIDYQALASKFLIDGIASIVLMGSHARGDFGLYSDIDIVRFWQEMPEEHELVTYLIDSHFVVVSNVSTNQVEDWFLSPEMATEFIKGVMQSKVLWDRDGYFAAIKKRADCFVWDDGMQARADALVSSMVVGWIEEVQKALQGLRGNDPGRLLNGKHGLTWGLLKVMRIHKGLLLTGDNGAYPEMLACMGEDSEWSSLCRNAFGVEGETSLYAEIEAGLKLYALTAELLSGRLNTKDKELIDEAVTRINNRQRE